MHGRERGEWAEGRVPAVYLSLAFLGVFSLCGDMQNQQLATCQCGAWVRFPPAPPIPATASSRLSIYFGSPELHCKSTGFCVISRGGRLPTGIFRSAMRGSTRGDIRRRGASDAVFRKAAVQPQPDVLMPFPGRMSFHAGRETPPCCALSPQIASRRSSPPWFIASVTD